MCLNSYLALRIGGLKQNKCIINCWNSWGGGGGGRRGEGTHLSLSHTHTPTQIFFSNALCVARWHKQTSLQSSWWLACPWSTYDNALVGSCSGDPTSWCFSGIVLESSEGRNCALWSRLCHMYCQLYLYKCFSAPKRGGSAPLLRRLWQVWKKIPCIRRMCCLQNEIFDNY